MSTPAQITGQLLLLCLDPFFLSIKDTPATSVFPAWKSCHQCSNILSYLPPCTEQSPCHPMPSPAASPSLLQLLTAFLLSDPGFSSTALPHIHLHLLCWVWPHPSGKTAFSISASPCISPSSLSLSCWHHSVEHAFLPETVPAPDSHDTILFGSLTYTFFAGSSPSACPKLLGVP